MSEWKTIESAPEDMTVRAKIDDADGCRNEAMLVKQGNLWFSPDMGVYVYYRPTHWTPPTCGDERYYHQSMVRPHRPS